jgi:hypothetical protein
MLIVYVTLATLFLVRTLPKVASFLAAGSRR